MRPWVLQAAVAPRLLSRPVLLSLFFVGALKDLWEQDLDQQKDGSARRLYQLKNQLKKTMQHSLIVTQAVQNCVLVAVFLSLFFVGGL